MRIQRVLKQTRSFTAFDLMRPDGSSRKRKDITLFYQRVCRSAAALLSDACIGVLATRTGEIRPHDEDLRKALLSDDPLAALREWEPVPFVQEEDKELKEAVAAARSRWPEFEKAFRTRNARQTFVIKVLFRDGNSDDGEWMWVEINSLVEGVAQGVLISDPVKVRGVKKGDKVSVPTAEVGDWAYNQGATMVGGFADEVVSKRRV